MECGQKVEIQDQSNIKKVNGIQKTATSGKFKLELGEQLMPSLTPKTNAR